MQVRERHPLIDVDELAERVRTGGCTVLDVRYRLGGPPGAEEYARGHIPGAVYVDLDTALASAPGPAGRHPLPDVGVFQRAMRAAGVRDGLPVVVYDDWAGRAAARCWWLLRWAGHEDVRVLDGGWSAWVAGGHARSDVDASPAAGTFTARPGRLPVLALDDVLEHAERGVLIDARNSERFRGEVEPVDPVAGHIPGAVNVPTGENLTEDGRFRPPEQLRALYSRVLPATAAEPRASGHGVAVYCGSGVTAAHDVLAMAVVGIEASLYPGSWSEWVADPDRPVATGG